VELYARVRRAVVVDKMSEREAAKEFGLARETVRKMLRYAVPPGYRRQQPVRRPKLDAWVGTIDQILKDDKARGKKQRHTPSETLALSLAQRPIFGQVNRNGDRTTSGKPAVFAHFDVFAVN
jgi:transposase